MNEQLALLDTSACLRDGRIAGEHAELIGMRLEQGELAMTEPPLLEMRYSARGPSDSKRWPRSWTRCRSSSATARH